MNLEPPVVVINQSPDVQPTEDCPSQMPQTATLVGEGYWIYGPGWPVRYSLTKTRTKWILWQQDDRGGSWGFTGYWESAAPVAWCPAAGVPAERAAFLLLRAWWKHLRTCNQGQPGRIEEGGLLSIESLEGLKHVI